MHLREHSLDGEREKGIERQREKGREINCDCKMERSEIK